MKKLLFSLGLVLAMSTSFAQTNTEELTTEPTVLAEKYNKSAKRRLRRSPSPLQALHRQPPF